VVTSVEIVVTRVNPPIGLLTATVRCWSNTLYYNERTILKLRVNRISKWLTGKDGKIDMRVRRAAAMAAHPASTLPGWAGGKTW
jgi:hypothetical protein